MARIMGKYDTAESVWLAAASLAYEHFLENDGNVDPDMMYFEQETIRNRAQEFCEKQVHSARVSQWFNADHPDHTKKKAILRGDRGTERRLLFTNELSNQENSIHFENVDENIQTSSGPITIQQLKDFVDHEYTSLFTRNETNSSSEAINCLSILEYLNQYGGEVYQSPDRAEESRKAELLEIKDEARDTVREFKKLADVCAEKFGLLKPRRLSQWLNGGGNRVRKYLWHQLKEGQSVDCPTSISVFAELVDGQARFKISVELDEAKSDEEDYARHHQILNIDISEAEDRLVYILAGNDTEAQMRELDFSTEEVKEKVENGTYKKIQIARLITQVDIDNELHNDQGIMDEIVKAIQALLPYYKQVTAAYQRDRQSEDSLETQPSPEDRQEETTLPDHAKNTILYGPPGTGKTYYTVLHAVSIIEKKEIAEIEREPYEAVLKRYQQYKVEGKISFTTFHQSYGYEEFIEGIKPRLWSDEEGDTASESLEYTIKAGVFKGFCDQASKVHIQQSSLGLNEHPTIWKVSLGSSGVTDLKKDCFTNDRIRIGWAERDQVMTLASAVSTERERRIILDFQEEMKAGDLVLTLLDQEHIDGIGVITGEATWLDDGGHYPRSRPVRWLAKNIKENILEINQGTKLTSSTIYRLSKINQDAIIKLIKKHLQEPSSIVQEEKGNYVFIVDEINRGNISKIFGELITLIEPTKRLGAAEEVKVKLPYSGDEFGVPNNVFILGTMNTADRSIALMDTALRRRFQFVEMMPDPEVLAHIRIEGIDLVKMLKVMNERIAYLYDREHTIGHAYFTDLVKEPTIKKLASVFKNAIIPLLQEYFYEDYEKIQLVLGDNAKEDRYKLIKDESINVQSIFKGSPDIDLPEKNYQIQEEALYVENSYIHIYQ